MVVLTHACKHEPGIGIASQCHRDLLVVAHCIVVAIDHNSSIVELPDWRLRMKEVRNRRSVLEKYFGPMFALWTVLGVRRMEGSLACIRKLLRTAMQGLDLPRQACPSHKPDGALLAS